MMKKSSRLAINAAQQNSTARFTELKAVTIVFTYPLTREARLEFRSETGFTRAEIIECIRSGYRKIYAQERKWGFGDTALAIS